MQENVMKKAVGVWIDHREAVIIRVADEGEGEAIQRISAEVEPHGRFSAHAPGGSPEDRRDRRFGEHLHRYYDEVIAAIRDADVMLIVGPGEAKGELAQRLEHAKLHDRIVGIETVDKLTDRQIVAKIRQHFLT
jgi:stalled ribosome rescue protein Dom34